MKLVNAETGRRFSFEFLYVDQGQERVLLPFFFNLRRLGIEVRPRLVDTSQYIQRLRARDFDMFIANVAQSLSPRSEEHTSELQSLMRISYAVFCLKKKKKHAKH